MNIVARIVTDKINIRLAVSDSLHEERGVVLGGSAVVLPLGEERGSVVVGVRCTAVRLMTDRAMRIDSMFAPQCRHILPGFGEFETRVLVRLEVFRVQ